MLQHIGHLLYEFAAKLCLFLATRAVQWLTQLAASRADVRMHQQKSVFGPAVHWVPVSMQCCLLGAVPAHLAATVD